MDVFKQHWDALDKNRAAMMMILITIVALHTISAKILFEEKMKMNSFSLYFSHIFITFATIVGWAMLLIYWISTDRVKAKTWLFAVAVALGTASFHLLLFSIQLVSSSGKKTKELKNHQLYQGIALILTVVMGAITYYA